MEVDSISNKRGLFIKQRALLKALIISSVKESGSYGLELKENIFESFREYGFEPTNSEIYKSLFELVSSQILERREVKVDGSIYETIVIYNIKNEKRAEYYINLVTKELTGNKNLIGDVLKKITKNA